LVKLFYANGSSWTAASRALSEKNGNGGRKFISENQRQVTKLERELTLRREATSGGVKTAVTGKSIRKVDKILDQGSRRSVKNIAKRAKFYLMTFWRSEDPE
jgi:hypothetical protein